MSENNFNSNLFTNETKKICTCTAISIGIIMLFVLSPLSYFFVTSTIMKLISILILSYIIYLNYRQIKMLTIAKNSNEEQTIQSQLNVNIICSYVFSLFIFFIALFVLKSFFFV